MVKSTKIQLIPLLFNIREIHKVWGVQNDNS